MPKTEIKMPLPSLDDLFTTQEQRDDAKLEKLSEIKLKDIDPFKDHPFKVIEDESLFKLAMSIKDNKMVVPAIVRKKEDGRYELVSGHRRKRACELIGLDTMPCVVRDLTDDEAIIIMVDSNMHREQILPSEKAFAYKMKYDALKHQGKRNDLTFGPVDRKSAASIVGGESGESEKTVRRFIRLTYLVPELLELVDNDKMGLRPAVEISYLSQDEQNMLVDAIQCDVDISMPSHAQAIKLKELSQKGKLDCDNLYDILSESKPNQIPPVKISMYKLKDYIPERVKTNAQREEYIFCAVKEYSQKEKAREKQRNSMSR